MRTINATLLAALQAGQPLSYLRGTIGYSGGAVKHTDAIISYKLTGTTLEFVTPYTGDFASDQTAVWLERGLTINGTNYTVTTSRFYIREQHYLPLGRQRVLATIFPKQYYSAAGDDTYENVITAFCTAFGKTAVFKDGTEAWLDYQFLPAGQNIITNDAMRFLNLLRQKRLIFCCDNGGQEVLFYSADVMGAAAATVSVKDNFEIVSTKQNKRQYVWKDELATWHQDGDTADPIHNLGYLESTDAAPARHSVGYEAHALTLPDLRFLDGDVLAISNGTFSVNVFAQVTEEYEPNATKPPYWRLHIDANPVFESTEGGALPSTIERISNYTPLNTSQFDDVLSENDNNLQAAMNTLDDHEHLGGDLLASNALNGVIAAGATMTLPFFSFALSATRINLLVPRAGILANLKIRIANAQPATGSLVATLIKNASATALQVTIAAGSAAGIYSDTANQVTVAENDLVAVDIKNNATGNSAQIGALVVEYQTSTY